MKKEEFFRRVFSVSTKAGYRLQYLYAKASCDTKFGKAIRFRDISDLPPHISTAADILRYLFLWYPSPGGVDYWDDLYKALKDVGL